MTNDEFDNADFNSGDKVEVRKYFGKEVQSVEFVDFDRRRVNGYCATEIIKHIKNDKR